MASRPEEPCYSFQDYDVGASPPPVAVHHDAFWSYCGPLLDDPSALPPATPWGTCSDYSDFECATFSTSILPRLLPLLAFANSYLSTRNLGHYLLTVRATSTPTAEYDRPRWHTDDLFFALPPSPHAKKRWSYRQLLLPQQPQKHHMTDFKLCATLLGPPTLFIPLRHQAAARTAQRAAQREAARARHVCTSIRCAGCASAADAVRAELDAKLSELGTEVQEKEADVGEGGRTPSRPARARCTVFRVGRDRGAVHSEPRISDLAGSGGRIFVNVVPGTEEELRGLMRRWGMPAGEFPRQWWIGSNMARKKETAAASNA